MLTPPRPQHEVVQNEQGRYIDIVTVMKGRQPVKKGRLYIKKKSEHRTQSTHSTNMSGKLGIVLFSKNIQSQRIYPNSNDMMGRCLWVVEAKKLAKNVGLFTMSAEFLVGWLSNVIGPSRTQNSRWTTSEILVGCKSRYHQITIQMTYGVLTTHIYVILRSYLNYTFGNQRK